MKRKLYSWFKKIVVIITVLMLVLCSFPTGYSYGVSASEAAKQVAEFAKAFADEGATKGSTFPNASITSSCTGKRAANNDNIFAYDQHKRNVGGDYFFGKVSKPASGYWASSNTRYTDKLTFDCSAFVSWVFDYTIGTTFNYANTEGIQSFASQNGFKKVGKVGVASDYSNLEAGDILLRPSGANAHAVLYVGDNEVVHSTSSQLYHWNRETDGYSCTGMDVYRLDKDVDSVNTSLTWPDGSTLGVAGSKGDGKYTLEDDDDVDDGEFEYYGIPQEGKYQGNTNIGKWLIDILKQIVDYLIGIMIMIPKMVIVGWTSMIEMWISSILDTITGDSEDGGLWSPSDLNVDSSRSVTVENIVLNKIPFFDINIFDFNVDTTVTGTGRPREEAQN